MTRSFGAAACTGPMLLVLSLIWPAGCGYALLRPDAGGPVPAITLGAIEDLSADGELGVVASRRLRRALAGRTRPRLVADGAPILSGSIRLEGEAPVGFDSTGVGALSETTVVVELRVRDAAGLDLWTSGAQRRPAIFARGPTVVETDSTRRLAVAAATRRCIDDAVAAYLSSPPTSRP